MQYTVFICMCICVFLVSLSVLLLQPDSGQKERACEIQNSATAVFT